VQYTLSVISSILGLGANSMDTSSSKPSTLSIAIGGYTGNSYAVELSADGLIYRSLRYGYEANETLTIVPDRVAWERFRRALDDLGVWDWAPEYSRPGIFDGTNWHVEIVWGERSIHSHGMNGYPGGSDDSQLFSRFLSAVRALVGGRDFY
jgi:hypothetical protein